MLSTIKDGSTVTYAGTDTGLGVAAAGNYTYDANSKSYSFNANGLTGANTATVLKGYLGTGANTAKISIGGTEQEVNIAKDGTITDTNGDALYLDTTGNLTKNYAGSPPAATLDNVLASATVNATIKFDSGMTVDYTAGTGANITGASISADDMAAKLSGKAYTVANGAESYDVAAVTGAVTTTAGNSPVYADADGKLTTSASNTVTQTYHEFANGNIYDDKGSSLYKAADGSLTSEAKGKSEATADPESSGRSHQLHRQIPLLPRCRSKPSGFCGDQPEQHHYQPV